MHDVTHKALLRGRLGSDTLDLMSSAGCPACGSTDVAGSSLVPDHEYGLERTARYDVCAGCRSLYQQPMPSLNELAACYPASYHSFAKAGKLADLKHRSRINRLSSLVEARSPVVLDFGCGDGSFALAAARARGWQLWGFEIAERRSKVVQADGRVTIVRGALTDLMAELPPLDLVTMNHVIEHLPDPQSVLSTLRSRMRPGAALEGQTPASDSLEHRVFGGAWSGYHAPRHTVVFSSAGLSTLLSRAGFVAPLVTAAFNPAGIAVSLASALHGPNGGTIVRQGAWWLGLVAAATALQPIDRLSGRPGMIDFSAHLAA